MRDAFGPIIKAEIPELQALSRSLRQEFLLSIESDDYYQSILFVDNDFPRIFNFTYIEGNQGALDDRSGLILTRSTALKYFGEGPALGKSLTLDHDKILKVTAVVADLPMNSHFNSSLINPSKFELVTHISALKKEGYDPEEGDWENLNVGDLTYLLVPEGISRQWLQAKMDGLFESHFPMKAQDFISAFQVNTLMEANTFLWEAIGMPVIQTVRFLALLVLIVAIVNYTNLATAQSLRRTREVGLRKTMGANRTQLLTQFLVESVLIAMISMIISVAILELVVPLFNIALGKGLSIDYSSTIWWLISTAIAVGLIAGAYPAYLITQTSPIHALRDTVSTSSKGGLFRSAMLGIQFAISIFMMAIVMVVYFQNARIEEAGDIYPRSQILTLNRLNLPEISSRLDVLRNELGSIPGVSGVAYSGQVPFEQRTSRLDVSATMGDDTESLQPNSIWVGPGFFELYDIPIIKGRALGENVSDDIIKEDVYRGNVVVNELLLSKLGYTLDSVNPMFYDFSDKRPSRTYTIVGVVPDQNFLGFHNQIKPLVFAQRPASYRIGSIRIKGKGMQATMAEIEATWDAVIPEYPIKLQFLDETFDDIFNIFAGISKTLAGFAFLAMTLSMVGLFGLAAYMVERKTREIGIRKIMGANQSQIVRLLIWQFSRPVIWASFVALPLAYFATNTYLDFFPNRLSLPGAIILFAGCLGVVLSWAIVSVHAMKVAYANPIQALRYE